MRRWGRGYAALVSGALAAVILGSAVSAAAAIQSVASLQTDPRDVPPPSEDIRVSEVPNAVTVANDGTMVAGLNDNRSIMILRGGGITQSVSLGCSPSDVAISPDASTAWAVCQGDPHLYVIDGASGQVSLAGLDLQQADDLVYLPEVRRLVIADLVGGIVLVDTVGDAYVEIGRVVTGADERPSELAVMPDGKRGFVATDGGALLSFTFASGRVQRLPQQASGMFLDSIALSRTGTLLYGGAALGSIDTGFRSAIVVLDPITGATVQETALDFGPQAGGTTIKVAPGYRSLTVATGMGIDLDGQSTGLFDIALDDRGRLGAMSPAIALPTPVTGSAVARSADAQQIAAGTVDARVVGAVSPNAPYSPSMQVQGRLKGTKLSLTGTTTGMAPGTIVTVYVRDATKSKSRFVAQAKTAVVDARGAYRWAGAAKPAKVEVFAETRAPAVSPRITITRTR